MFDLFGTNQDPFKRRKNKFHADAHAHQETRWLFKQLASFSWQAWTAFLRVCGKEKAQARELELDGFSL